MAAQEGGTSTQPVSALVRSTYLRLVQQTALTVRLLPPHPPPRALYLFAGLQYSSTTTTVRGVERERYAAGAAGAWQR